MLIGLWQAWKEAPHGYQVSVPWLDGQHCRHWAMQSLCRNTQNIRHSGPLSRGSYGNPERSTSKNIKLTALQRYCRLAGYWGTVTHAETDCIFNVCVTLESDPARIKLWLFSNGGLSSGWSNLMYNRVQSSSQLAHLTFSLTSHWSKPLPPFWWIFMTN